MMMMMMMKMMRCGSVVRCAVFFSEVVKGLIFSETPARLALVASLMRMMRMKMMKRERTSPLYAAMID